MFQSLKTRLILSRVIIFFLRVGVWYIHVLFLIMLIRLGFLSRPHSSLFSNLQKHLSSLTHHENKEREKWGNSFRFQWRLHCLRINCFLYSLRFLLWGFRFFFWKMERRNYFITEIKACRFYTLSYFIFSWKVTPKSSIATNLSL